jgi:hypothetical protein
MKKINSAEFCYLAKSELFLTWLKNLDTDLHQDLMNFLMGGHGCSENRVKMYELLRIITKNRQWAIALESFLVQHFPAMIIDDTKNSTSSSRRIMSKEVDNKHKVFTYYDSSLATFPRRIIFSGGDLHKQVNDFCSRQFYCEWVIIEDRAYIEYVAPDAAAHKENIPDKNWQIRAFKKKSNI